MPAEDMEGGCKSPEEGGGVGSCGLLSSMRENSIGMSVVDKKPRRRSLMFWMESLV